MFVDCMSEGVGRGRGGSGSGASLGSVRARKEDGEQRWRVWGAPREKGVQGPWGGSFVQALWLSLLSAGLQLLRRLSCPGWYLPQGLSFSICPVELGSFSPGIRHFHAGGQSRGLSSALYPSPSGLCPHSPWLASVSPSVKQGDPVIKHRPLWGSSSLLLLHSLCLCQRGGRCSY